MSETWLPVPGYEGRYEVSDQGLVRSYLHWRGQAGPRLLAQVIGPRGRLAVSLLSEQGSQSTHQVHRLVALAFLGPLPDGLETRHLDGNCRNNVRLGVHPSTRKTVCSQGHPFSPENTRVKKHKGSLERVCRACARAYKMRKRAAA